MRTLLTALLTGAFVILWMGVPASEASFVNNATGLTDPARTIDFSESTLDGSAADTAYAAYGVTFSNLFISSIDTPYFPNTENKKLVNWTRADDFSYLSPFTISFANSVTDAAFVYVANSNDDSPSLVQLFLKGTLVESANVAFPTVADEHNFLTFTGSLFDEIVVTPGSQNPGAMIDNLQFSPAPVPEPGTFLLLGAGLAGLCVYTRRRRHIQS